MNNWVVTAKKADFKGLGERLGVDQVITRIMVNRGVPEDAMADFLHPDIKKLHDPILMKDMDRAVFLLMRYIDEKKKIRVIGDYDIDGINSTYILLKGIKTCGGDVDYAIPHRIEDGYGINPEMVDRAADAGVELIITCDNGISATPAIERAHERGMQIIVTDHHQIPFEEVDGKHVEKLPSADVVVDPHRSDDDYPFSEICGAVVAWKLIILLYQEYKMPSEEAFVFLENAAFATVGDIMPLLDENRTMVHFGLQAMAKTKNPGLSALIERTGIDRSNLNAYHLGFVIGPCFNASGRLETADQALELLLEEDPLLAGKKAAELIALNDERKNQTLQGTKEAEGLVISQCTHDRKLDKVLVVYVPGLHESLCGIVAGRLKGIYNRPTFVLTDGKNEVKGSGRSIPAYSMFEKMTECSSHLLKFGGHPMAAGLSLKKNEVDIFRQEMNERSGLSEEDLIPEVVIDVPMPISYLSFDLIRQLDILEPFGNGNEKPVFADKGVAIHRLSYIGKEKQYLKLALFSGRGTIDGLYFGDSGALVDELVKKYGEDAVDAVFEGRSSDMGISFTYYPQINSFRGSESMQVIIDQWRL
ncbi:MAG: single-stranded-DNA-specific exonuclease RecJ [Lachnospiraceae bacterium]|nr:single-stranded-DNA-specific exonuclease RecJ [Lachnospiraceae bacterium]